MWSYKFIAKYLVSRSQKFEWAQAVTVNDASAGVVGMGH